MKKLSILLSFLMMIAMFVGCAADVGKSEMNAIPTGGGGEGVYDSNSGGETAQITDRKLIRTITIDAETKDLDALLTDLDAQLAALGGYVQTKQVRGNINSGRRYASMTLRIPADKLDQFVKHVSGATNILSSGETTEDVTLKYIATESRIAALEAEEADETHAVIIEPVEDEHFITVQHPMTKQHFISFVAYVTTDRMQLVKLYPEGNAETRLQLRGRGYLYWYCNRHGLYKKKL
jgi:desulfoferrodoxin (superoxide reductase-like protein)